MKNVRQEKLLQIISEEAIETQEQLLQRLNDLGIQSTQATISRDIKQLHLVKEPTGQGRYRYAVSVQKTKLNFADKLRTIFRESVISVEAAQNIVVLKTIEGMAQGAAFALDNMDDTDIVGTLAGEPSAPISRWSIRLPSSSGAAPSPSHSAGFTWENSALTNALLAPVRIRSREVRWPSTALMASITMDLPAPVSPVRALKPGRKAISASSMMAIFSI